MNICSIKLQLINWPISKLVRNTSVWQYLKTCRKDYYYVVVVQFYLNWKCYLSLWEAYEHSHHSISLVIFEWFRFFSFRKSYQLKIESCFNQSTYLHHKLCDCLYKKMFIETVWFVDSSWSVLFWFKVSWIGWFTAPNIWW